VVHHAPGIERVERVEQVHHLAPRHETHFEGAGRTVTHYEPRALYSEFSPARRSYVSHVERIGTGNASPAREEIKKE